MTSLGPKFQEIRELGARGTAFRLWWEFKTRSGMGVRLDRRMREREAAIVREGAVTLRPGPLGFGSPDQVPLYPASGLLQDACDAVNGRIVCFGRGTADYGNPVDWYVNPRNGERWPSEVHWAAALRDADRVGDVKLTWEIGRFPHAYLIARAAVFSPDHAEFLRACLVRQLESFEKDAPFGFGVHWYSGQEVAIRALALIFAYHAFGQPDDLRPFVIRALCRAGLYIEAHIEYARHAVFNNHLIWEALGLFLAGQLLVGLPQSARWARTGREILDQQADRQFYADGGYIQQSHTYHRMALQAYLSAITLVGEFPQVWRAAMERSLDFLTTQQHAESGQLPNFGPNDGALPCVLSTCDYTDFRPTLQAVSLLVRGERLYRCGPWDEEAAWWLRTGISGPPVHPLLAASRSFAFTGQHVLRGKNDDSFGVFRCGSLHDRFGQIDMLHLDVWWRGQNVLVDPGSFLYNGPGEWHNHFLRTESHNTVRLDGLDQMLHYRKFKCLYPTEARLLHFEDQTDCALAAGEHYGYQRHPGKCVHRREVLFMKDDVWVVVDRLIGQGRHHARLHWLGGDFPYQGDGDGTARLCIDTPRGTFCVSVFDASGGLLAGTVVAGQTEPPRGWLSRYYGEKVPVPSLAVETSAELPLTMVSILGPDAASVSVANSTWAITTGSGRTEFELSEQGIGRPRYTSL